MYSLKIKFYLVEILRFVFQKILLKKLYRSILYIRNHTDLFKNQSRCIHFKKKFYLNLSLQDWIQNRIFFLEYYEDYELKVVEHFLKPNDNFIDIGANFGLYSFYASQIVGKKGNVIAFEPYYLNIDLFNENLKKNKSTNIILVKKAVEASCGEITLKYDENENNLGMVSKYLENYSNQISVESVSIDDYFLAHKLDSIKFIKLDIEGGEFNALLGMKKTLLNFKPILQIEIDDEILNNSGNNRDSIYSILNQIGFEKFHPVLKDYNNKSNMNSKNQYFKHKSIPI